MVNYISCPWQVGTWHLIVAIGCRSFIEPVLSASRYNSALLSLIVLPQRYANFQLKPNIFLKKWETIQKTAFETVPSGCSGQGRIRRPVAERCCGSRFRTPDGAENGRSGAAARPVCRMAAAFRGFVCSLLFPCIGIIRPFRLAALAPPPCPDSASPACTVIFR